MSKSKKIKIIANFCEWAPLIIIILSYFKKYTVEERISITGLGIFFAIILIFRVATKYDVFKVSFIKNTSILFVLLAFQNIIPSLITAFAWMLPFSLVSYILERISEVYDNQKN